MKLFILTLCAAYAVADVSHIVPKSGDQDAKILKQDLDVGPEGTYQWAYETENGIAAHEHGEVKKLDAETSAQQAQGQAQWTSPEGEVIQFAYIADENGYQPTGSHIPTPPPIPEAILRGLEYIRAHPPPPEKN